MSAITKDVKYIGINSRETAVFEGQFKLENGMAYNSYLIDGGKTAVMDTVDAQFTDRWMQNLSAALEGKQPDYLIVQHMEPDHSGSISAFMEKYPGAVMVASERAFVLMRQFYGSDYADRRIAVKEGDTLELGTHTLRFIAATMIHWPEVVMTYDCSDNILFSADAFGKFGVQDADEEWDCEARRYYFGIVGKYGVHVQKLLKKVAELKVDIICPLHGPVLTDDISRRVALYDTWSSYTPENTGVVIAYTTVYGNTEKAVKLLEEKLVEMGQTVSVHDLRFCDIAEAVEDAFRYDRLVLATTTYNNEIFPPMRVFINELTERGFKNRTVGIIENGSWMPTPVKVISGMLEKSENLVFCENRVRILSALNEESKAQLNALALELCGRK